MKKTLKPMIAIMAMTFIGLASSATSPALATIAKSFPDASSTAIASIATLSSLTAVPFTIVSGLVVGRRIKFRTLACIGLLIVCLGGFMPFMATSMTQVLIGRALLGMGSGLIAPIATTLTLALFTGEEVAKQLGRNGMSVNIGAVIFQLLGGYLCNYSWRMPFVTYLAVIPVFFIVLFLLPEPDKVQSGLSPADDRKPKVSLRELLSKHVLFWGVLHMAYMACFYPFVTEMSGIVQRNGYGDATTTAYILSLFTAVGVLGGYLFHFFNSKLGKRLFSFGFLLGAASYAVISLSTSIAGLIVAAVAFGFGYGLLSPAINYYLGIKLKPELRAAALSVNHILSSCGSFGSAFLMAFLRGAFSSTFERFSFVVGAVFFLACTVYFLLLRQKEVEIVTA